MTSCLCLGTCSSRCCFEPMRMERHAPGDDDVVIDVKYCGVCHSDLHFAKNDMFITKYPCVPGHEVAGVVRAVGSKVDSFAPGDHVGVGCFVDSCLACKYCERGDEHMCAAGETLTYNAHPVHGRAGSAITMGGYTTAMVVDRRFVIPVPKSLPLDKVGPLLCAGVTTYTPLRRWGAGPGVRVGVHGLGGLGTMAVKQAKAMGATVTVLSRSRRKEAYAMSIGADALVVSSDREALRAAGRSLDLVIDTVAQRHDLGASALAGGSELKVGMASAGTLLDLLDVDGVWCYVGAALDMVDLQPAKLLLQQHRITGSKIGSIKDQRDCVSFCAEHGILPETEVRPATPAALSAIYEALDAGNDAGTRYVLDVGGTLDDSVFDAPRAKAPRLTGRSHLAVQIGLLLNRMALAKAEDLLLKHSGAVVVAVAGAAAAGTVAGLAVLVSRLGHV